MGIVYNNDTKGRLHEKHAVPLSLDPLARAVHACVEKDGKIEGLVGVANAIRAHSLLRNEWLDEEWDKLTDDMRKLCSTDDAFKLL